MREIYRNIVSTMFILGECVGLVVVLKGTRITTGTRWPSAGFSPWAHC